MVHATAHSEQKHDPRDGHTAHTLALAGREFLTRLESTARAGIICSRGSVEVAHKHDARVAVRVGSRIYEAVDGEVLHAQITVRVLDAGASGRVEDGWTFPVRIDR